jgi:hypothetical protein
MVYKNSFNLQDTVLMYDNYIQLKDTLNAKMYVANLQQTDTVFNIWQLKNMMHATSMQPDLNKKLELLAIIKQCATDDKILKEATQILKKITPKNQKNK